MFVCLVLLRTRYGFVENVIVVRTRKKVGNRARCGGWVVCIASKTLHSRVYFVCTHTKYMVSGDCIPGVCTARVCRVHTTPGCFHTNQHVNRCFYNYACAITHM